MNLRRAMRALLALLLLSPAVATASELPGATAFNRAADALLPDVAHTPTSAPPPLSDPRVKAFLVAADMHAVFGSAAVDASDIQAVVPVCSKANRIGASYLMAATEGADAPHTDDMSKDATATVDTMRRNAVIYQDLIVPMSAFVNECTARLMPLLASQFASIPPAERTREAVDWLDMIRMNLDRQIAMALMVGSVDGLTPARRHEILAAAAATAPTLAQVMTVRARIINRKSAGYAMQKLGPSEKASLEAIEKAFADQRCEGLCLIVPDDGE